MKSFARKSVACLLALVLVFCTVAAAPKVSAESYQASLIRMGGSNRYETADRIAADGWTMASTVIIASGKTYPDALAGTPLSYALDAPILLVDGNRLDSTVKSRISALGATKAYILGGSAAVSVGVENALKDNNMVVERIWGQNRYETATAVADRLAELSGKPSEVFIVSGENYPDALSVGPVAAIKGAPILYSSKNGRLSLDTFGFISGSGAAAAHVIGGYSAVGDSVRSALTSCGISNVSRVFGNSRYETSLEVAIKFLDTFTSKSIAFATGKNYPDALAGGVFAAKHGAPLLLTDQEYISHDYASLSFAERASSNGGAVERIAERAADTVGNDAHLERLVEFIAMFKPENLFVFGGESVLPDRVIYSYLPKEPEEPVNKTPTISGYVSINGVTAGGFEVMLYDYYYESEWIDHVLTDTHPFRSTTTDEDGYFSYTLENGEYTVMLYWQDPNDGWQYTWGYYIYVTDGKVYYVDWIEDENGDNVDYEVTDEEQYVFDFVETPRHS